jgi:hypothetical protein
MQRAVDSDHVTLTQHLLKSIHASASNLFLNLGFQWLVVKIEKFLAVKWLKSSKNALTNAADSNSTYNFSFQVIFILCRACHIPVSGFDLFVCRDKVSNKVENGHDDMFGDRNDIGSSDLGDGDTTIDFVCSIQIDMV